MYCSNPANLIKGIRIVRTLELSSSYSFEMLYFFRRAMPEFVQLHILTITLEEDVENNCLGFLPYLLPKTPNLKILVMKGGLHHNAEQHNYVCRCVEEYKCLLSCNIETLEVTLLDSGTDAELEQVRQFLGKLRHLKLLKVCFTRKVSLRERTKAARKLESFLELRATARLSTIETQIHFAFRVQLTFV